MGQRAAPALSFGAAEGFGRSDLLASRGANLDASDPDRVQMAHDVHA
jgi:hypothetical protein